MSKLSKLCEYCDEPYEYKEMDSWFHTSYYHESWICPKKTVRDDWEEFSREQHHEARNAEITN